ncbi:ACT domain-containing protein [Thermothelomyces heterothallicus CBS 202.75]|uniref:ACT domain-containing protein n=1 Tax=Thermothelomyces heterothallicus CBS 202.75 TaxID=1149848 RepID=UPI003741FB3F
MTAQVSFLDGTLSLIHIPLDLYSSLLQPILKILLPPSQNPSQRATGGWTIEDHSHGFLNISVTPIECSIVCNSSWASSVFEPAIHRLPKDQAKTVAISRDTYVALSVYGTDMDAGSRVAELTSPLALANIPIFFITTYYSDFILVPTKDREAVVKTLLARNFVFSDDDQSRLVSANPSPTSTAHHPGLGTARGRAPSNPESQADTVSDLQQRTFDLLKRRHVTPRIEPGLTLVQCSGIRGAVTPSSHPGRSRRGSGAPNGGCGGGGGNGSSGCGGGGPGWVDTVDTRLYTGIVAALAAQPRFLSVTLAQDDPPSLLVDKALLKIFGSALVGPMGEGWMEEEGGEEGEGALVPIFLDLADLPFEATGIVSGVAGRLVRELNAVAGSGGNGSAGVGVGIGLGAELSYLSTARAGAVILGREQAAVALGVLKPLLAGEEGSEGPS